MTIDEVMSSRKNMKKMLKFCKDNKVQLVLDEPIKINEKAYKGLILAQKGSALVKCVNGKLTGYYALPYISIPVIVVSDEEAQVKW